MHGYIIIMELKAIILLMSALLTNEYHPVNHIKLIKGLYAC